MLQAASAKPPASPNSLHAVVGGIGGIGRRTRRWRERKARGAFMVTVEVNSDVVARLLADGYLQGRSIGDITRVAKADVPTAVQEMLKDYGR